MTMNWPCLGSVIELFIQHAFSSCEVGGSCAGPEGSAVSIVGLSQAACLPLGEVDTKPKKEYLRMLPSTP